MPIDTIDTLIFPKPPSQVQVESLDDVNTVFEDHTRWFREVGRFNDQLYEILHSGYLVRDFQVENLSADKIIAGIIGVDQIYLFDNKFELNGALQQIIVKDNQGTPVTRVEIGKFGSGSDYGIKIRNAAGTVVFQATSSTFIDGAVITNATISDSKIIDLNGSKLTNSSVGNAKISDLSASKINAGTLTVNGSPGITVTGSGNLICSNGADLIFNASASGTTSYIKFRNSSGTSQGDISWNATTDDFMVRSLSGLMTVQSNGNDLRLVANTGIVDIISTGSRVDITASANSMSFQTSGNIAVSGSSFTTACGVFPSLDKTYDLGSTSKAWSTVYADNYVNVADIQFQNGMVILEADKVYENLAGEEGQFILNHFKKPVMMIGGDGNLYIRGKVITDVDFDAKYHENKPIVWEERQEKNRIERERKFKEEQLLQQESLERKAKEIVNLKIEMAKRAALIEEKHAIEALVELETTGLGAILASDKGEIN